MYFSREINLIGQENFDKLKNSKVAVFGIGGVGSYIVEGLARLGVGEIWLFDKDIVDGTNINRQIIATHSNREEHAKLLANMIKEKFNPKEVVISTVGRGCGASIGPGLCVAFYLGTPISEDFVNEKAIISEITGK